MATQPVRLVHASDLRLDRPLYGLAEAPNDLRELLRDAPLEAAERVFDTALAENADALLLAGDVLDARRASPRVAAFLLNQFSRLEKRGVRVFWAGGECDPPDAWPRTERLPDNVTVFPVGRVESHELRRGDAVVAIVQGISKPGDREVDASGFRRDAHGRFTVGVAYGTSDAPGKEGDRVDYMALGGRSRRATVDHEPGVAHYAGSPQGRCPTDQGPSGCTVVQVDESGKAKTRFVATDIVRWHEETVEFTAGVNAEQLRTRLRERLDKVRGRAQGVHQLIAWRLEGVGPIVAQLRPDGLSGELLADLQKHAGREKPLCWTYAVTCRSRYEPPHEQLDQETILGDLLRQVDVMRNNEAFVLDLAGMLPKPLPDPSLASVAQTKTANERVDLFNDAAKLGVALMTEEA
ncbi:putative metallophosphoesterase YhaO [Botrimarina colliarenosi]|uniref:Putative metallophosphoesterase YhaO n=1 Tax=Botrimarina colliarenosi TaxID=2528001 RepID=A0A5C6AGR8_9BACT|nr:metallophosphoesterase [Botrimarina colliarenosi]TWT99232.1 putative metallophosphoesterase YhaO [Botrimarina colliarenosi]